MKAYSGGEASVAADALYPMTWSNLFLTGDMHVSSCCFTPFVTVGIFSRMYYPGRANQALLQPELVHPVTSFCAYLMAKSSSGNRV